MKKSKLTIIENWNKNLTLSENEKRFLIAGDGGDGDGCKDSPNATLGAVQSIFTGSCVSKDCNTTGNNA